MNTPARAWPALRGLGEPTAIECERGVFGKMHGARSDFRWIARSAAFLRDGWLEDKFALGSEDLPTRLSFWRCLPEHGCYIAGYAYPSRAQDASGRRGFLEKQFLQADNRDFFLSLLHALR